MLWCTEDQNRNVRRSTKQAIEGFYSLTIGQEEIHQYGRYGVRPLHFVLAQTLEPVGTAPDPYDLKRPVARVSQGFSNVPGIDGVVLDEKYILRHNILLPNKTHSLDQTRRTAVCAIAYTQPRCLNLDRLLDAHNGSLN